MTRTPSEDSSTRSEDMSNESTHRDVAIPAHWYLGAGGDPIAVFDYLVLELHTDGTVTWRRDD